ncbi:MAG: hypothetical protein IT310_02100 [Anaerolineales bacterium]|nr:hypothetical protein [Anaerolineales bacterium]
MISAKRPVFFNGENPAITLYDSTLEQKLAVASFWHCADSPLGVGRVLIFWLANPISGVGAGGIFTDNPTLAQALVNNLVRHFPEFKGIPIETLALITAESSPRYDGKSYQVLCQTSDAKIDLEWQEALDRKQILWDEFPAGETAYDLTTTIRPCRVGRIKINNSLIAGEVKVVQDENGVFSSSAFLAFAETWVGPLNS